MKKTITLVLMALNFTLLNAQDFTLGTLPDIQNLTVNDVLAAKYYAEMQYFIDNKTALNLQFVSSLGDNTAYGYNGYQSPAADFQRAKNGFDMLKNAGIPYSPCLGNHDMDYVPCMDKQELSLTRFNQYFPVSEYSSTPNYGGSFRNMSNNYFLFSASGMDFIVVTIQSHDPHAYYDQTSIAWANGVIDQYPNRRAILMTHDFYDNRGLVADIIKKHDNLFMAVCGHTCARESYWTELSPGGNIVHVLVTDYQCDADKGATLRYYTFKPAENKICAYTYNAPTKTFETDANSQFCMDYVMTTNAPSIALSQSASIIEGAENGKSFTVKLTNDQFVANLTKTNWTVSNLPAGVSVASVNRISATEATITLTGSSTIGTYTSDITTVSVTVAKAELSSGVTNVTANKGITLSKAPFPIPGKIEAEGYTSMLGVQLETSTDAGAGQNVGFIDAGDWMNYKVNVAAAGTYTVNFRVASTTTGKSLLLQNNNGSAVYGTINLPNTGGWQTWQTVSAVVQLNAGVQELVVGSATGGFNVNWMQFTSSTPTPFITLSQSATIKEAEEDGKTIKVTLHNDKFSPNLTSKNWTITNLPAGVTAGNISRSNDTVVVISLIGNSVKGTYTADITNVTVAITLAEMMSQSQNVSANSGVILTHVINVANGISWNSYDLVMGSSSPQAIITSNSINANLEFYESSNDDGVDKTSLFTTFDATAHQNAFNNVNNRWFTGSYPYAGVSTVARGSDANESNTPTPTGAMDLMLHPPSNNHLTVCAFIVPQTGSYSVSGLAARRVSANGASTLFKVFNAQKQLIATITATNNNAWASDANIYTLGTLQAGDKIYFATDNDADFAYDATEISWTVTLDVTTEIKTNVVYDNLDVYPNPATNGILNIDWFGDNSVANSIQIYDVQGRLRMNSIVRKNETKVQINIQALPAGVYMLNMNNTVRKFVVQ
ncbi:MAG: carbohydrate-binding protein [Bacteroidetes bacterium]|nr:carbohydrate-binding protein [Bacteroidota bacterium]